MSQNNSPLVQLYEQTNAQLAALAALYGDTQATVSKFGGRALNEHDSPPRYVWIPARSDVTDKTVTRQADQPRTLFTTRESIHIHCWGSSHEVAWVLRGNMLKAIHDLLQADIEIIDGQWVKSETGDSWAVLGEVYRLTIAFGAPIVDQYIPLSTLIPPEISTVQFAHTSADFYNSQAPVDVSDGTLQFTNVGG